MKILFYCDTVFSFGGVQRVLAQVAKALSDSHDVTILTTDQQHDLSMYNYNLSKVHFEHIVFEKASWIEKNSCKAYGACYKYLLPQCRFTSAIYLRTFFLPTYRKLLVDKINSGKYDVVIGVHAYCSLHVASVKSQIEARTVGWMHNSYEAFFEKRNPYLPRLKRFFQYSAPLVDKIIVLSSQDQQKYRTYFNIQAEVIYNPLSLQAIGRGDEKYKKFLSVGRFSQGHKGFDLLISAFDLFSKSHSNWTLDIVGEGPEEKSYRQLIDTYDLHDRVKIHPFTEDIQSYYANSSVYVLSSRWEGMPLVLVEAMAHGLPVISSDLPISKELMEGKGVAVFFTKENVEELADQLGYMADVADIGLMGACAYEYSKLFSIENVNRKWNKIIN